MTTLDPSPLRDEARQFDQADPLACFRTQFHLPRGPKGGPAHYLVGNSLGLQPKRTASYIGEELSKWQHDAVHAHFSGPLPWMPYHECLAGSMAALAGARPHEVVTMNSLTVNLHLMLASLYRPTLRRHKILIEAGAFPSDHYAVESHITCRGGLPEQSLVLVTPQAGQELLSTERICDVISKTADALALVWLPAVQYYTGQRLDVRTITAEAHRQGALVGFDLAHAIGNVPLNLHGDDVDFAVWCSYKYLNSGPGSVGGCYLHERHARRTDLPRLAGWWGHDKATRFRMENQFQPIPTVEGWQLSNPPILSLAAIRASLEIFAEAGGMEPLREKSVRLTGFLDRWLSALLPERVRIITHHAPEERGCQLSLEVLSSHGNGRRIIEQLESRGVVTDWREPNVLRVAPVPLYNTFEDVAELVVALAEILDR